MLKYNISDAQLLLQIPRVWPDYARGDPDAILIHGINTIAATTVANCEAAAVVAAANEAAAEQAAVVQVPIARQVSNPCQHPRPAPVRSLVMYFRIIDH
jgi:hypothetical protein